MRNRRFCFIGILFPVLGCLVLGCAGPLQELQPERSAGIVRVTVGNGSRTLMPPSLPPISSYRFSFESREESPQRATVVRDSTDPSLELELTVGAWFLTVTALAETGSGVKEIARGSAGLLVLENITNSVTVQLGNEPGDEPGSLRYAIQFPDTVNKASLTLTSLGGGVDPAPVNLLTDCAINSGVITKAGILNAAAGNYLLTIDLYGAAGNAGKTEVVHIYSNTETEAPAAKYTFSSGLFNPTTEYQTGSQSLYEALTAIGAASGADFTVILNQDEPAFASFTLSAASFGGKKVRIRGGGHRVTLNETGSLFTVETGAVLVLQDLELHGRGLEIDNNEALISVTGGSLLINPGTVITENHSASSYGGGVFVSSGTFTMNGGSISDNSAYSSVGGGVYVGDSGIFTMSGGTISGNSAYFGGGVYVGSGAFTMSGGSILGNSSPYGGGGVFVNDGTFTMSGGAISGNSSFYGGGVYVESSSTFTMSGGTISGNSANEGGGVSVGNSSIFTMSGGTISGNSTSYYGGGVYVSSGTFIMSGGAISDNSSSGGGGGVYVGNSGTFTMNGRTISGNSANEGGGVYVGNSGTFTMSGGSILGNSSSYGGGGVFVDSGTFTMNDGTISGNFASSYGGAVFAGISGTFTMSGGAISNNSSSYYGGGVFVGSATFTMNDGTISDNFASSSGGAVSVENSGTFTMSGGSISNNSASSFGGGVSVENSGTFIMNDGTVVDNSSSYGSGIYVNSGTFTMGSNARIDPSNEVYLSYGGSSITLAGGFSGSDTIAVIDLNGGAADWLGKSVLARDAGYTGTIPADRFTLGSFVNYDTKTPITSYVINSEGRLVNK